MDLLGRNENSSLKKENPIRDKFNSVLEELFYDLLVDFDVLAWVKKIETQKEIRTYENLRRIDFLITLHNDEQIFIEVDSKEYHSTPEQKARDRLREYELNCRGVYLMRFTSFDMFVRPQFIADELVGRIELLLGI